MWKERNHNFNLWLVKYPRGSSGTDIVHYLQKSSRVLDSFADDAELLGSIEDTNRVQLKQDLASVIKWSIRTNLEPQEIKFEVLSYTLTNSR